MNTHNPHKAPASEALRISELRYRRLFEAAQDGILILDAETGMVVDVNPFLIDLLGYSHADFLGKKVWDLGFFKDIAANEANFAELQAQEYIRYENLPLETAKGLRIAVEFVSNVYLVDHQKVIQCNIRDISAHNQSKAALRESEEEFRAMFELSSIGMAEADPQTGCWTRINPKMAGITGYSEKELLHTQIFDLTHPEDREKTMKAFKGLVLGETPDYRIEKRYIRKDGLVIWVSVNMTVCRSVDGKAIRAMGTVEDITERKQLTEHFLRAQRLENIGTLASGIAHDLNNILAPIIMAAELLNDDIPAITRRNLVSTIHQSAQRGADIVSQVLTFARGVDGQKSNLKPYLLATQVEHILSETFPKAIRLTLSLPKDLWMVSGNATQLHQVLLNLCVNARDSMMPQGGTLVISAGNIEIDENYASTAPEAKPGRYVAIKVIDSGCGIPASIIEKIFDPFFTTKETGMGTGLGLSTAVGIIRSHNGFIKVESAVGSGSVFEVFIPASLESPAAPSPDLPSDAPRGNGETVLLIDDEPEILKVATLVLTKNGYLVLTGGDGVEGLTAYVKPGVSG